MIPTLQLGQFGRSISQEAGGAYWNPADKNASIVLSLGNTRADRPTGTAELGVRGITGKTAGKWYFEIATTTGYATGAASSAYAGVASATVSLSGQPIFSALGGQYVCARGNAQYGTQSGSSGSHAGSGWASQVSGVNTVGFAVDVGTRNVTMYDYGGSRFTVAYASTSGAAVYPWAQIGSGMTTSGLTLRVLASEFAFSIPATYSAWG